MDAGAGGLALAGGCETEKSQTHFFLENGVLDKEVPVNQPVAHAELIATYRRAEAEADHKFGLIKTVAAKGPKAIQTAIETAAKAAKRRDSYAEKLAALGVDIKG